MKLRSRILEFFSKELLSKLYDITNDVLIPDTNTKVDKIIKLLNEYDLDFDELGPGTNRLAIFMDSYVFKIALDSYGVHDNWREFIMSTELQPFVSKTYECNGLIAVEEYVVLISKEEFNIPENKESMKAILATLADSYLLGDIGTVSKNFTNWGYRSNGDLVALDYAYVYRIIGEEMICKSIHNGSVCQELLQYDDNFYQLFCPRCRKKYSFHQIRNRIDKEFETRELELVKSKMAYKLTQPVQEVKDYDEYEDIEEDDIINDENDKEDTEMAKDFMNTNLPEDKDPTEMYIDALEFMFKEKEKEKNIEEPPVVIDEKALEDTLEELTAEEDEYVVDMEDIPVYYDDHEEVEETNIEFDLDTHETKYVEPIEEVAKELDDEVIEEAKTELTEDHEDEFVESDEEYDDELPEEEVIEEHIVEDTTNVTIEVPEDSNVTIKIIPAEESEEDIVDEVITFDNITPVEEIEDEVVVEAPVSNVSEGVVMKFYNANEEVSEDDIRNELKEGIMDMTEDEEYDDEYDDQYDDIINDRMSRKYNKNRGDF